MLRISFSFLFIFLFLSQTVNAEFLYFGRSQEGLLMGDAYTAVADDENTMFYNPAALARHGGVSLTFLNPSFTIPNVLKTEIGLSKFETGVDDRFQNFPSAPADVARRVIGEPLYLQIGVNPTIKMEGFAFQLFANSKTDMILENAISPVLKVNYRYDKGFMLGYGWTLGKKFGKKSKASGNSVSLGAAVKSVSREGLNGRFDLFGTQLLEVLSNSDNYKALREALGYSKGSGFGLDLGMENNYYLDGNTRLGMGVSFLDVGGMRFKKNEGIAEIDDQDMSVNIGTAWQQKVGFLDYTLAMDYHNAADPVGDFASKLHIGARLDMPVLDLYWGWNGGYGSFGLGLDAFFLRLTVGFYGLEIGHKFKEKEAKRMVVQLKLLDIHFDL